MRECTMFTNYTQLTTCLVMLRLQGEIGHLFNRCMKESISQLRSCDKSIFISLGISCISRPIRLSSIKFRLSNYCSYEGVLYCKPHFDQLFKMTGSLDKSFEGAPKTARADRSTEQGHTSSKVSSMFGGTQDKCVACKKTVYPLEKVAVDGTSYHRACFKCSHGGCVISPSNYVAHEHQLYCRHHHTQLFKQKGNFSQLDKHEQAKEENGTD